MLTSIYEALFSFLSQLPYPVYLADCVPEGAALPYITMQIEAPLSSGETGALTLTAWSTSNAQRLSIASILSIGRGKWLATTTGALILTPDGSGMPVQAGPLLGLQSRWKLDFFPSV